MVLDCSRVVGGSMWSSQLCGCGSGGFRKFLPALSLSCFVRQWLHVPMGDLCGSRVVWAD